MESSDTPPTAPPSTATPERADNAPHRTSGGAAGRALLAVLVLLVGAVVALVGPLLAVACAACQDGVRAARFGELTLVLAHYGAPLVALVTALGVVAARRGVRAGALGLGAQAVLFLLLVLLGSVPA